MKNRINVYITTGKRNLKFAYPAIKSLFINNAANEVYLYVISEDLTRDDMQAEIAIADEYGHHIEILKFDEETAGKYIHYDDKGHWPIATMSSYWLFHELLPKEVDRIIVIESDTVVVRDLWPVYSRDFENNYCMCPDPAHKPKSHREFMKSIGGDTLTFVCSIYNVNKIREDFSLEDILKANETITQKAGYSQMEFTFGLLFKDKIKYLPGPETCIDQNERYAEELGYDYMKKCEDTAVILHFSSYSDYSKPWNPVRIMPGYYKWWEYATDSPYYEEYFTEQWKRNDGLKAERKAAEKTASRFNILLCSFAIFVILMILVGASFMTTFMRGENVVEIMPGVMILVWALMVIVIAGLSLIGSLTVRKILCKMGK